MFEESKQSTGPGPFMMQTMLKDADGNMLPPRHRHGECFQSLNNLIRLGAEGMFVNPSALGRRLSLICRYLETGQKIKGLLQPLKRVGLIDQPAFLRLVRMLACTPP